MDSHAAPSLLHIRREPFKTDPFRQGADIFVGATNTSTSVRTFAQAKDPCMIPEAGQGGLRVEKNPARCSKVKIHDQA